MATNTSLPEAQITRPDEPKSSSNGGMNAALILAGVLTLILLLCVFFGVPNWNWNADATRPQNMRDRSVVTNPDNLPAGTKGAIMHNKGKEGDGDLSHLNGQPVQGDTITNGPKGPETDGDLSSLNSKAAVGDPVTNGTGAGKMPSSKH